VRIVAGRWRGRTIKAPPGDAVRPTADRVREAWMSIVGTELPDARVLDLFAGSGALGIEALSRGARSADFVEMAAPSLAALRANLDALRAGDAAAVHRMDVVKFVAKLEADAYDVAFADPPYKTGLAQRVAERWLDVPFAGLLCIEHSAFDPLPGQADVRRYGSTAISFYRAPESGLPTSNSAHPTR
jgi:16S rRNA (guanine966-N2)-methyltransferase